MSTDPAESTQKDAGEPWGSGTGNRERRPSISAETHRGRADTRLYACEHCGNLVVADERPRRCLNCRRGVSEHRLEELYAEVAIVKVVD